MSSTSVNLQDFLKDIKANYQKDVDKAREGGGASGAWDGPPMPLTQEYRVNVDKAEYKASNKGPMQLVVTYEITEPAEFVGRKVQAYYQPNPGNEIAQSKFATLIGALGPDLDGVGTDWETLAKRFEGTVGVVALETWGDADDRYGIRWINSDRGQTLSTNVKPKKAKKPTSDLRPNVVIPKNDPPFQPVSEQPLPEMSRPVGGPNLPPGLR